MVGIARAVRTFPPCAVIRAGRCGAEGALAPNPAATRFKIPMEAFQAAALEPAGAAGLSRLA